VHRAVIGGEMIKRSTRRFHEMARGAMNELTWTVEGALLSMELRAAHAGMRAAWEEIPALRSVRAFHA
jgi:hypothetical protein